MRPARDFIMPRSTARESTKALFRLVDWMSSHSSSFMRMSRLSRVTPALFTRIETGPTCAATLSTSAAQAAESRTSSTRPVPCPPASAIAFVMRSAPASVVAVPTTFAPAFARAIAIASPMPREAPVTSATCPCSMSPPQASAAARAAESVMAASWSPGAVRFARPASTLPGAHSTSRAMPCPSR